MFYGISVLGQSSEPVKKTHQITAEKVLSILRHRLLGRGILGLLEELPGLLVLVVLRHCYLQVLNSSAVVANRKRGLTEDTPEGAFIRPISYKSYEKKGFQTPSGKVELYSEELAKLGHSPLPVFIENPESPESRPDLAQE